LKNGNFLSLASFFFCFLLAHLLASCLPHDFAGKKRVNVCVYVASHACLSVKYYHEKLLGLRASVNISSSSSQSSYYHAAHIPNSGRKMREREFSAKWK
jgi:hypothetical protein